MPLPSASTRVRVAVTSSRPGRPSAGEGAGDSAGQMREPAGAIHGGPRRPALPVRNGRFRYAVIVGLRACRRHWAKDAAARIPSVENPAWLRESGPENLGPYDHNAREFRGLRPGAGHVGSLGSTRLHNSVHPLTPQYSTDRPPNMYYIKAAFT